MPSADRILAIEWRPGAAQLAPMVYVVMPSVAAAAFGNSPGWVAWLLVSAASSIAGWTVLRYLRRARRRHLMFDADWVAVDGMRQRIVTTWSCAGWSMLKVRGERASRRLYIHRSEVGRVAFARLQRHLIATVPQVTPLWRFGRDQRLRSTSSGSVTLG